MDDLVARMIELPSRDRMQSFYTELNSAGIGKGLTVMSIGGNKGKGIVATRDFSEGEVVLIEPPLVAAQDTANKAEALVCSHCFRYVGSLELQIGRRLAASRESITSEKEREGSEANESESEGDAQLSEVELAARGDQEHVSGCNFDKKDMEDRAACCADDEEEEDRIPAPPETIAALLDGSLNLLLGAKFSLPAVVECLGGCSENVYCSSKCARLSWEAHHKLLCLGHKSEAADLGALREFTSFADGSNDIFHVAAQVVAATVLRARKGGGSKIPEHLVKSVKLEAEAILGAKQLRNDDAAMASDGHDSEGNIERDVQNGCSSGGAQAFGSEPTNSNSRKNDATSPTSKPSDPLLKAWEPFSMGWKGVWWESMACPPEMVGRPDEEAAFRTSVRELCEGSLGLLRAAFGRDAETYSPLFSLEVYSCVIGMFELNNLALVVESPVEEYFLAIDELPDAEKRRVEPVTKPLLDALGRSYAAHCVGTAFYILQSCANHSCAPNARAFKREEDVNGHAVLLATQDIKEGEEVTISYIDETEDYESRQRGLEDYGFLCRCSKCITESSENR